MGRLIALLLVWFGLMGVWGAHGFELAGNQDVGTLTYLSGSGPETIVNTGGDGSRTSPYVFNWANKDGSGGTASANLNLNAFKIYDSRDADSRSFVLQLNGGSITGSTAAGVYAFDTRPNSSQWTTRYVGHIVISNVSDITCGAIAATHTGNRWGGDVMIGDPNRRAGNLRIGGIDTTGTHYDSQGLTAGNAAIYGNGDVFIRNDGGKTNVVTWGSNGAKSGNITISHAGSLVVGALDTGSLNNYGEAGHIALNGSHGGSNPTGSATIGGIWTSHSGGNGNNRGSVLVERYTSLVVSNSVFMKGNGAANNLTIRNVGAGGVSIGGYVTTVAQEQGGHIFITNVLGSVKVSGDILTRSERASIYYGTQGGHVTVQCGGDIEVGGDIDMGHALADQVTKRGVLNLTSTGGSITLALLDLGKIQYAALSPARGAVVRGALAGFNTNAIAQTELRAPAGARIIYYPLLTENAYLDGRTYVLADMDGRSQQGGLLKPWSPRGTVIILK